MLRFHADRFVLILNRVNDLHFWLSKPEQFATERRVRNYIADRLEELDKQLLDLGLHVSRKKALQLTSLLRSPASEADTDAIMLKQYKDDFLGRLEDELDGKLLFCVTAHASLLIDEGGAPFGTKVSDCFHSASHDIDEAGKCLALRRPTACVMHLMRVLELGLDALACELGLKVSSTNWNTALNEIEAEIRSRTKATHGTTWKDTDEPFFAEAAVHFRLVKNAWRNHAQHARAKYTDEEAEDIYRSVGSFMRHLSKRLAEPSATSPTLP